MSFPSTFLGTGILADRLNNGGFKSLTKGRAAKKSVDSDEYIDVIEPEDEINLDKNFKHDINVVVDRMVKKEENRSRIHDSLEVALGLTEGLVVVKSGNEEMLFSTNYACKYCDFSVPKLEPRLFSFNSPLGACHDCNGLGFKQKVDIDLLIPDFNKSIREGGIYYYKNIVDTENVEWQNYRALLKHYNIDLDKPLKDFTKKEMDIILYGSKEPIKYEVNTRGGMSYKKNDYIEGVVTLIERRYFETTSAMSREWYGSFMMDLTCPTCHGKRLNEMALSVQVGGKNIMEFCDMSVTDELEFINSLEFGTRDSMISKPILKEIRERLTFLKSVGLEYLNLSRSSGTLSGGESQRIRLATQIGSSLMGVLYILDEPSIGLHQRDNDRLITTLKRLRDLGNTVIVVEHDEDTMRAADYIVDVGPGAGIHGGNIVFSGTEKELENCTESITSDYLTGRKKIPVPEIRRKGNGTFLEIKGAAENNLKKINVKIPLGTFACVTGVSGSGKSSFVNDIVYKVLANKLNKAKTVPGAYKSFYGIENLDKVINIDQAPIGRTPRSNPATYTGVFGDIRELFASTKDAKMQGYTAGRFSFNVKGGRCEACQGDGILKIEMHFLPDIYVPCEVCGGKRYNRETLNVKYKGKSIYDVLEMTVEEGMTFFESIPKIHRKLKTLFDVGLGYIKIGQPATTLSGGEAQRVKLAAELSKRGTGKTIYILDEPTTGLHTADVHKLIEVLQRFVDSGNTVLVIEHNLDVIKTADYIIDLGPEGGDKGGTVVCTGTPEKIAACDNSYTGKFLKKML